MFEIRNKRNHSRSEMRASTDHPSGIESDGDEQKERVDDGYKIGKKSSKNCMFNLFYCFNRDCNLQHTCVLGFVKRGG